MYNYNNFPKKQRAVALKYNKDVEKAPKVVAIGSGLVAKKIIDIATENNIPIHEDADLAKILSALEINQYIPVEVYGVVAEILAYIYKRNELIKETKLKP